MADRKPTLEVDNCRFPEDKPKATNGPESQFLRENPTKTKRDVCAFGTQRLLWSKNLIWHLLDLLSCCSLRNKSSSLQCCTAKSKSECGPDYADLGHDVTSLYQTASLLRLPRLPQHHPQPFDRSLLDFGVELKNSASKTSDWSHR